MKIKCFFSASGQLLNIGEWDRQVTPAHTLPAVIEPAILREDGVTVLRAERILHPARDIPELVGNEIPAGVEIQEREITVNYNGRFLADDHNKLRKGEYPPIGDQLDALWKIVVSAALPMSAESASIAAAIEAVKAKFPKK